MARKTTEKKTETKKVTKKVTKKQPVKKTIEEPKVEIVKENVSTKKTKLIINSKLTAILYFICGACWIISAIFYIAAKQKPIFDFVIGFVFIVVGILYLVKDKRDNTKK
jgi:1,4-dihydroxy-2-naphthoate octaprenyltransferase